MALLRNMMNESEMMERYVAKLKSMLQLLKIESVL